MKIAKSRGCSAVNGGIMFVGQAVGQTVAAFELFTSEKADVSRVESHLLSLLKKNEENKK